MCRPYRRCQKCCRRGLKRISALCKSALLIAQILLSSLLTYPQKEYVEDLDWQMLEVHQTCSLFLGVTRSGAMVYNMEVIAKLVELPQAFIIGAGAARSSAVGVFAELAASVKVATSGGEPCCCNSYSARVDLEDGSCVLERLPSTLDFEMMGNFFCSEGNPGKVLEIKASKRTGEENFMSAVRKTLQNHYKTKPVALGGVFLVEKGKAKLHVIPPKFPNTPLDSDEAVNSWLRFYEMDAILVCVGELVSHDLDLDLRVEHFHCFSDHGQGGHYHYDTTPNDVVYRAYFNVAEFVYRIDQPVVANKIYHS